MSTLRKDFMTIEDKIGKGIMIGACLMTAANLYVGAATLADKTGLAEAFAVYSDAHYRVYDKLNEDYPWLAPMTWHEEPAEKRVERYEFCYKHLLGFMGLMVGSLAASMKEEDYNYLPLERIVG
jgi:hypothetical protein